MSATKESSVQKNMKKVKKANSVKSTEERGLILIKDVPHGFYEKQLKEFFSQFGKVTRTRVARSKKTGVSKRIAYVEFAMQPVAKVAAEAMNNYMMFKSVLKVSVVDPSVDRRRFFAGRNMTPQQYPGKRNRANFVKVFNKTVDPENETKEVEKLAKNLRKQLLKVRNAGFPDFRFVPVDLPASHSFYF